MKIIPTTETAAEKIRSHARELAKGSKLTYQQALEMASRHAGYESWRHVRSSLKASRTREEEEDHDAPGHIPRKKDPQAYIDKLKGIAEGVPIERSPERGLSFHSVEIDGHCFSAFATIDGPTVQRLTRWKRGWPLGWVQLGVAGIHFSELSMNSFGSKEKAWSICKYGPGEPRVPLEGFSTAVIHAVAYQFGIPISNGEQEEGKPPIRCYQCLFVDEVELFYRTPAFQSLCAVATRQPRRVRSWGSRWGVSPYLGAWTEHALAGERIVGSRRIDVRG